MPEYVLDWPERRILRDAPLGTPTAQASNAISSGLSEGSGESGDDVSSTSPTILTPGKDLVEEKEGGVSPK